MEPTIEPTIIEAIHALRPGAQWVLQGSEYSGLDWRTNVGINTIKPTEEEVVQKIAELKYEYEVKNEYQENRKHSYPPISDQLDKIYHSGVNAWKAEIKIVKDKYPKVGIATTALQARKDAALADLEASRTKTKTDAYLKAKARLDERKPSEAGTLQVGIESVWNGTTYEDTPVNHTISPITDPNDPIVIQDNKERAEAQAVVDATPQAIIDANS
tara:strand:- start:55 stop:699 length:645 start_codon:yes stop_codon:yes gene_type:complete